MGFVRFKGFISFKSLVPCLGGGETAAFFSHYVNPQASVIYIFFFQLKCSEIMERLLGKKTDEIKTRGNVYYTKTRPVSLKRDTPMTWGAD